MPVQRREPKSQFSLLPHSTTCVGYQSMNVNLRLSRRHAIEEDYGDFYIAFEKNARRGVKTHLSQRPGLWDFASPRSPQLCRRRSACSSCHRTSFPCRRASLVGEVLGGVLESVWLFVATRFGLWRRRQTFHSKILKTTNASAKHPPRRLHHLISLFTTPEKNRSTDG